MRFKIICPFLLLISVFLVSVGCTTERGTLSFTLNGEHFVEDVFTSRDGWQISFTQAVVTLSDVTAYQSNPAYDSTTGDEIKGNSVSLPNTFTVDLIEMGSEQTILGEATVPIGQYNALSWEMIPDASGAVLRLVGSAERDQETINFDIAFDEPYSYKCGEYIGENRMGFVRADETADTEITFHYDHIFGDGALSPDEAVNLNAPGFDLFAGVSENGQLNTTMSALQATIDSDTYQQLAKAVATIGHVGEGHCYEATYGHTAHQE